MLQDLKTSVVLMVMVLGSDLVVATSARVVTTVAAAIVATATLDNGSSVVTATASHGSLVVASSAGLSLLVVSTSTSGGSVDWGVVTSSSGRHV